MRFQPLLLAMIGILALSTASWAHDKTPGAAEIRPVTEAMAAPAKSDPARQLEIFQILQGGAPVLDDRLSEHLWRVAGSLAVRNWKPPTVKISVVVRDSAVR